MIIKFLLMNFVLFVHVSCSTAKLAYDVNGPVSKLFYTSYDQVWKSVMLAMEAYSIEEEDREKGFLRTEVIKGLSAWKPPFAEDKQKNLSQSYVIYVHLVRGMTGFQPGVQVRVLKKVFVQKGFINEPERVPSDGLEEKMILYRIMREIDIDRFIMRRHQEENSS